MATLPANQFAVLFRHFPWPFLAADTYSKGDGTEYPLEVSPKDYAKWHYRVKKWKVNFDVALSDVTVAGGTETTSTVTATGTLVFLMEDQPADERGLFFTPKFFQQESVLEAGLFTHRVVLIESGDVIIDNSGVPTFQGGIYHDPEYVMKGTSGEFGLETIWPLLNVSLAIGTDGSFVTTLQAHESEGITWKSTQPGTFDSHSVNFACTMESGTATLQWSPLEYWEYKDASDNNPRWDKDTGEKLGDW